MAHWLYNEFTKLTTLWISFIQVVVHWEDIVDRFSSVFGIKKFIERRKGETHMNITKIPSAVEDTIELIKLIQEDWAIVAPQNPALIAMAEKVKTDWEMALGINDIAAPMSPEPPKAS